MPVIKFIKEKKEIEVPAGANLRKEALKAGVNPHSIAQRHGRRASASYAQLPRPRPVRHVPGEDRQGHGKHQPDGHAWRRSSSTTRIPDPLPALAFVGNEDTMRLACQTLVNGDIEVETAPTLDLFGENFFS